MTLEEVYGEFVEDDRLDEFIKTRCQASKWYSAAVQEEEWDWLYVRGGPLKLGRLVYQPALVFAHIELKSELRGNGAFTQLVDKLRATHPNLTVVVEDPHDRFERYLTRRGWSKVVDHHKYLLLKPTHYTHWGIV